MTGILEAMRAEIVAEVFAGFTNSEVIIENAIQEYGDQDTLQLLRPYAEQMTREAVAAHQRGRVAWPNTTDCDRLDAVFSDLERAGIVARQHFGWWEEIGGEMGLVRATGKKVRGYAFYDMQDTKSARESGELYLKFGAVEPQEDADVCIGQELVKTLNRHGLATHWDGSRSTPIGIKLDWKRRRPFEPIIKQPVDSQVEPLPMFPKESGFWDGIEEGGPA